MIDRTFLILEFIANNFGIWKMYFIKESRSELYQRDTD